MRPTRLPISVCRWTHGQLPPYSFGPPQSYHHSTVAGPLKSSNNALISCSGARGPAGSEANIDPRKRLCGAIGPAFGKVRFRLRNEVMFAGG